MGRKGNHRHLTGLASSKFYNIHRKEHEYVIKAAAGRHTAKKNIPLALAIKKAAMAETNRDVKRVLNDTVVMVNNRRVKEPKYPVGLNDVIELKGAGKSFV